MSGGFLSLIAFILYPLIVFFLTKRYFEEKYKADNAIFNKSMFDYEELLRRKYLEKPLRSLQYGLLAVFIAIGNELGAFIKYSEMTRVYSTVWQDDKWTRSDVQNEMSFLLNFSYFNIVLVLAGFALIYYSYYSKNKIQNIKNNVSIMEGK
jgi:hypothetical protein